MLITCSIYLVVLQLKWYKCTKKKKKRISILNIFQGLSLFLVYKRSTEDRKKIQLLEVIKCGWKNKKA